MTAEVQSSPIDLRVREGYADDYMGHERATTWLHPNGKVRLTSYVEFSPLMVAKLAAYTIPQMDAPTLTALLAVVNARLEDLEREVLAPLPVADPSKQDAVAREAVPA